MATIEPVAAVAAGNFSIKRFIYLPATSARLSRASFMSHLLAPPLCRAGPSPWLALCLVWNGLSLALRSLPRVFFQKFLQQLKTPFFGRAGLGALLSSLT